MPDEAVAFTDAETTLAWSDFEYDWEFTEE
jgi:hypothetical protein